MDFNDSPQEAGFRVQAREWIAANRPTDWQNKAGGRDQDGIAISKAWQKKKYDAGWACIHWPKEYGGRGATPIERVIWSQEEGELGQLGGVFIIGQGMCAPTIMAHGSDAAKQRHVPKVASGEEIWCQLFSEPGSGSDLAGLRTRAEKQGDEWVINGQKIWTSGAHYADFGIVITRTDPTVAKHKGLTMFYLDMRSPGVTIKPIKQVSGRSDFNEVYFADVRIPDSQRLGAVGDGWKVSLTTLMNERLAVGGGFPTNFEEMFDMIKLIEGEDGPAIEDQSVREKMADWYIRSAGLRNTSYRMISALSRGQTPGPEASISKLVLGINRQNMASTMLDIQDTYGVISQKDLAVNGGQFHEIFFRAVAHRIEGGTDEILRNIIAERVLGLPGDIRVDKDLPFNQIPSGGELKGLPVLKTRFTEEFGIKYPIVQGGMQWVGRAELVSAVANAGALGFITALTQPTPEDLAKEIKRCREMTDQPFGVNLTILPTVKPTPYDEYARAIIEGGVKIIETAGRNPEPYMPWFKEAGVKVIHKCTSVRHGVKAQQVGCDAVSMDGFECAGHPGEDDVPNLVLLPAAADQLTIPMIASGGFGDGRGLVAALALGAEGINMGTRFMATKEAPIHENVKRKLVESNERDTQLVYRKFRNTARIYKNDIAKRVHEIETTKADATFEDIKELVVGVKGRSLLETGEMETGVWSAGTVMGIIKDIPTVKELVERIVREAEEIINQRLKRIAN